MHSMKLSQKRILILFVMTTLLSSSLPAQEIPKIIGSSIPIEKADIGSQPLSLLARFPNAGSAMAQYVADAMAKAPALVDSILSVIGVASPEQASAIGAGLVRGLRAMEAKQPGKSTKLVSDKVMKSDNLWLKTTFHAIGPSYNPSAPFVMPQPLPPVALANVDIGSELPVYKSRVGPTDPSALLPFKGIVLSGDPAMLTRHGMIVAIMTSDKKHNGAVSTSPTI